jgi:hypothetical protein
MSYFYDDIIKNRIKNEEIRKRIIEITSNKPHSKCVYFILQDQYVKIGCTSNIIYRFNICETYSPISLKLVGIILANFHHYVEREIQYLFRKEHKRGEWYFLSLNLKNYIIEKAEIIEDF